MRENLVLMSANVRPPVRRDSGGGRGSAKATRREEENVVFSWREIARYFWTTNAAKRLFDIVEVLNLRKNI